MNKNKENISSSELKVKDISWDSIEGQEFGGQSPIVNIEPGQAAGPFILLSKTTVSTEIGTAISYAASYEGQQVRMPLSATFVKAVDQAQIDTGDEFYVRRTEDVKGKTGRAKGQTLQVYGIKVTKRADHGA
jgi:hypothetical protein